MHEALGACDGTRHREAGGIRTMSSVTLVEIAVQDAAGVRAAFDNGADRVELVQALSTGGLTPSAGMVDAAISACNGDGSRICVLVRPRPGGFVYNPEEAAIVWDDIRRLVQQGVGGVVIGALTRDGLADVEVIKRWQEAAGEKEFVFHRAIDASADPDAVFDSLLDLGVHRVLTSGGAPRTIDGVDRLAAFVRRSGDALQVTAGGGLTVGDIASVRTTGVHAVHLSARTTATDDAPTGPGGGGAGYDVTDVDTVIAAVAAARQ